MVIKNNKDKDDLMTKDISFDITFREAICSFTLFEEHLQQGVCR